MCIRHRIDMANDKPDDSWFVVMRQDDNGNEIEVARFPTQAAADAVARDFEARAHKQIYWVVERR